MLFRLSAPAVLLALAAVGATAWHVVRSEGVVVELRTRAGLEAAAREGAALLAAEAAALRERLLASEDVVRFEAAGNQVTPPPPLRLAALAPVAGRDDEGGFYLAAAEREEGDAAADPAARARAESLYLAAAAPERDRLVRAVASWRLSALASSAGRAEDADRHRRRFLADLEPGERTTREALLARARDSDPDLIGDLAGFAGGPDEDVALGLLATLGPGPGADAAVAERRSALARARRLSAHLDRARASGAGARWADGRIVAWQADGAAIRLAESDELRLPGGVSVSEARAAAGGPPAEPGGEETVSEEVVAAPPFSGTIVTASLPAGVLRQEARRRTWLLGGVLGAALLCGVAGILGAVRAFREEARAARDRVALLTRVGHDLRTPLAKIRMYAETLASGRVADPAEAREFAAIAAREAEALSRIVGTVLDLSRGAGSRQSAASIVDPDSLAREVLEAHRPLLEHAGIAPRLRAAAGPARVRADADALRGALGNLVENVLHHAASGRVMELETESRNGHVAFRVLDRGPGLPAGLGPRVFERFVRGPDARSPGAGLGLALVREVAAAHGGEASAEDRAGGGAVLTLRLPSAGAAP